VVLGGGTDTQPLPTIIDLSYSHIFHPSNELHWSVQAANLNLGRCVTYGPDKPWAGKNTRRRFGLPFEPADPGVS